ncbi:cytochrome P450 [Suillus ampliporus]|nr:cytochrome P450 [Suillus ampliporus]
MTYDEFHPTLRCAPPISHAAYPRAAACLGIIGVIVRFCFPKSNSDLPLPPSPPTWRPQGHLLPPRNSFLTTAEWIDEYGPLITIRSRFKNVVIIGSYKAAVDIMENQGHIVDPCLDTPWGERGCVAYAALHTHLQPKAAEAYEPLLMLHAKDVVLDILDDPSNFQNHIITYSVTTMMKVAYGKATPTAATDPEVIEVIQLVKKIAEIFRPGAYMVEWIPWLRYLPWYGRDLRQGFETGKRIYTGHMNRVKEQMQSNVDIGPSFVKHVLESSDRYGLTETELAFLAGTFFGGGSTTNAVSVCMVLMAAACFPEEQAILQAEIDDVIGRHRAPTFADQESLPGMHAFISESLRWRPVVPNGGHFRFSFSPEVYNIHTAGAIARDPEAYPDPYAFKPQRWIDDQGRLRDDLRGFPYGFGRRVCPGLHVADRSIFICSVLILWAFRLTLDPTKPLDDMGYTKGEISKRPCSIEFEMRVPEMELRRMMQSYPEFA